MECTVQNACVRDLTFVLTRFKRARILKAKLDVLDCEFDDILHKCEDLQQHTIGMNVQKCTLSHYYICVHRIRSHAVCFP